MTPRSSLPWVALVLTLAAPHAYSQCNNENEIGVTFVSLAPGCSQPGTPVMSIGTVGPMLEFSIQSQHPMSMGQLFVTFPLSGDPFAVADCLIHIDPNLIVSTHAFQTDAQGAYTLTAEVPTDPQLLGMTFVLQSAMGFWQAPIGGVSVSNAFLASVGCMPSTEGTATEGCGPLFWGDDENFGDWPAQYTPTTLFSAVFENAFPGLTLDQVLGQVGTPLDALGRHTVAALLNAATIPGFPLTTAQVISMFNTVFPGGNYSAATEVFEVLNSGDCPFKGTPTTEGCGPAFWSDEDNLGDWPAQYTPTTLFSAVFDDAFPGLTLDQVLEQSGTGLNALGRQTVAALLNAATITGFPLTTAQVIAMFNAAFPGGNYAELTADFLALNSGDCPFAAPTSSEGCSQGFWKNHADAWPAQYSPNAQFSSVFENAFPGMTFQEVLEQGGGGLAALGRQLVAALLNAATIEDFPFSPAEIIAMFNAVFPGGDYEELKDTLEELNEGECPFDDPPTAEGCGVLFWSDDENNQHWPAQYTPNTLFSTVFEDAFPGLTLAQVLDQAGDGLNFLGRVTVAALLNAATIEDFPLTTAEVISMFNAAFPSSSYRPLIDTFVELNSGDCPFDDPSSPEGCSVTFWRDDENNEHWPAQYTPNTLFSTVFEDAFPGLTFAQVLDQPGDGLNQLGRLTVAALLNAATLQNFPLTTAEVISMFNAAFPSSNYRPLIDTFLELNSGDCPFDDPSSAQGCSHGFWKNHSEAWPSEYSPTAQFSSVFENAFAGMTLQDVLEQGGGGINALGRQLVAALLNAATIEDFEFTPAQIIAMFNAAFPGGDYGELHDTLEELNSGDCPF